MEFNAYVVRTNALRKVFVSIKGFYYQAEILGQSVTWLVPHQLAQVLPVDVDYRVMLTFLEFYETMLQFVNFKLYHMIEVRHVILISLPHDRSLTRLIDIITT
jgi:pescadillo protein